MSTLEPGGPAAADTVLLAEIPAGSGGSHAAPAGEEVKSEDQTPSMPRRLKRVESVVRRNSSQGCHVLSGK